MSIIIRLQNLPLSAKSGDIRRFFGGLRIPNGGVHIVGGNQGDAFIAFTTDEDARLAMRKDGGKILDTRVKLFLSSRVEMRQEIGRITIEDSDASRQRAPTGRQRSRSPLNERGLNYGRSYHANSPSRRGQSPYTRDSHSPGARSRSPRRRSRSPRRRSRSPRKRSRSPMMSSGSRRSRSPMMSSGSRRSRSPIKRTFMPSAGQRSASPHRSEADSSRFGHEKDMGSQRDEKLVDIEMLFGLAKGSSAWKGQNFARQDENVLLEQKIAEALSASLSSIGKMTGMYHNPRVSDPPISMQGGRIGESEVNMHRERIGEPMVNMHGGRLGEPITNIQGGRFVEPGLNVQRGRVGEPSINMHGGRICEPNINIQGGRVIDPVMNIQGGRIGDLGINMSSVRREEQFSNLNPNAMPFQPEYNNPGLREMPVQENNRFVTNMLPSSNMNMLTSFPPGVQPLQYPPPMNMPPRVSLPPPMPMSTMPPPLPMASMPPPMSLAGVPSANMKPSNPNVINPNIPLQGYFVTVSGLNPLWNVNEIQNMLKGTFVPSKNVKWELDDKWSKTGTAFVKLYNKDDFMQILSYPTYSYNSRIITVSECPDFMSRKYFVPEIPSESSLNSQRGEFYHKITGLPYEANYDNVLSFFDGLDITDMYIIYSKNNQGFRIQGKATGIAFIAFGNSGDSSKAMSKNGQRFGNSKRVINISNSTKKNMLEAKLKNSDLLSQSTTFVRVDNPSPIPPIDRGSFKMHPLCTLLTGLPHNVSKGKIINLFKKRKALPGTIHIMFNDNHKPNGRAFVEFNSWEDFDRACQCHGRKIGNNTICVKQILYEEMVKCLESQERNSFENTSQNQLHSYSHPSTEMFQNQSDPGKHFPIEENYRTTYDDRERNSGRNIIQVFEYGNESREPIPVPNTTSNHSLNRPKQLKPCIKTTKSSYVEDPNSCLPSQLSLKNNVHKPNETLHVEESRKPESSFSNVVQKSNQSAHSGESKKPEPSFKNDEVQKSNPSRNDEESGEPEIIFEREVKKPDQSTQSKVSSKTEIENEALKIEMEEETRIPVKFEVKIKPAISKSIKIEDAFDNADPKKKLSKLSPERVVPAVSSKLPDVDEKDKSGKNTDDDVKNVDSKSNDKKVEDKKTEDDKNAKAKNTADDKNAKTKGTDDDKKIKTKSPDVKNVKTKNSDDDKNVKNTDDDKNVKNKKTEADKNGKAKSSDGGKKEKSHEIASKPKNKSPDKIMKNNEKARSSEVRSSTRRDSRDSKSYRSRNRSRDRSSSRKYDEYRRRSPLRSNAHKRPISRSPLRRSNYPIEDPYTRNSDQMAVVQLCNVDPLIGSAELLNFFYQFDVDADKIIRRIDERGEPTGDVRVTFRNHRTAEVAIRNLNGSYLNGLPVSMFLVD